MTSTLDDPTRGRRLAAIGSLVTLAAAAGCLGVATIQRWPVLLVSVGSLIIAVLAAWYVVSRRGPLRLIAGAVAAVAIAAMIGVLASSGSVRVMLVALLLGCVSTASAGYALRRTHAGKHASPARRAEHPALLINPRSGGGKATRFSLAERCRQLGVEPVVLHPADDLLILAEDLIARGADLIGMAGGDGSQAVVASAASRAGVPFVVIPAGTRNHFALDLGIDRADVPAALEAFRDGIDVKVDLAEVNGRTFVNNAAMGAYASIVSSDSYRDAKLQTSLSMLPDLLVPHAAERTLRVRLPSGEDAVAGQLLLVSNNPYRLGRLRDGATRESLDEGLLGVLTLQIDNALEAERLAALELAGQLSRYQGWQEWRVSGLEVSSEQPVEIGVDGEALTMDPPLHFVSRPKALTVRVPRAARIESERRAHQVLLSRRTTLEALWRIAFGPGGGGR